MVKVHMYVCCACKKPQGCINLYIARNGDNEEPKLKTTFLINHQCPFGYTARWLRIKDLVDNKDLPEMMKRVIFACEGGDLSVFDKKKPITTTDRFTDLVE